MEEIAMQKYPISMPNVNRGVGTERRKSNRGDKKLGEPMPMMQTGVRWRIDGWCSYWLTHVGVEYSKLRDLSQTGANSKLPSLATACNKCEHVKC